jgi:thymidylate synthase-like protein
MTITAEVILDSISPAGHRLTTFKLRYPKFIHSEFMTHRVFSRNASSSRAVPTSKLIEEVRDPETRASPVFWGKNQPGMQAYEELPGFNEATGLDARSQARLIWDQAAQEAVICAQQIYVLGAHKQIVNRILEPFLHINVVCTATEYMNFFGLRLDAGAQPEMRALAEAMWKAYVESSPQLLSPGQWHLPFIDISDLSTLSLKSGKLPLEDALKVSVARCARVSYNSHFPGNKKSTLEEDLKLYERLVGSQPVHASPAEHQATPDNFTWLTVDDRIWANSKQHANFTGWRQYRKMLIGENVAPLPEKYR